MSSSEQKISYLTLTLLELEKKGKFSKNVQLALLATVKPSIICFRLALLVLNSKTIFLIFHLRIPTQINVYTVHSHSNSNRFHKWLIYPLVGV